MTPRFRMIAGPNGSGKTTLCGRLSSEFAVNLYTMVNADDLFAAAVRDRIVLAPLPVDRADLDRHVAASTYPESVLEPFRAGRIVLADGRFRFLDASAVTTYTVALLANFVQERMIAAKQSFSQETVFSHPGKIDALRIAKEYGYRTYLYFVAIDDPHVNALRVRFRALTGGHDVPPEKIASRYERSLRQIAPALPFLSRAFFFDNSGTEMIHLASFEESGKWTLAVPESSLPNWFRKFVPVPTHPKEGSKTCPRKTPTP